MEVGVQRVLASVHRGGDGSQGPAFSTYSVLVLHDSGRAQSATVCDSSCGPSSQFHISSLIFPQPAKWQMVAAFWISTSVTLYSSLLFCLVNSSFTWCPTFRLLMGFVSLAPNSFIWTHLMTRAAPFVCAPQNSLWSLCAPTGAAFQREYITLSISGN